VNQLNVTYSAAPDARFLTTPALLFATLDERFARIDDAVRAGAARSIVQDAADHLRMHLILTHGTHLRFTGVPGAFDDANRMGRRALHAGLTERQLERALDLNTGSHVHLRLEPHAVMSELQHWPDGLVFVFGESAHAPAPVVRRRLNLSNFFDRVELEFLQADGFHPYRCLRAHRLDEEGRLQQLRCVLRDVHWTQPPR